MVLACLIIEFDGKRTSVACRVWYDCASELFALEKKHKEIAKEVAACEAARDRGEAVINVSIYEPIFC